jgi:hypothetical protein
VEFRPGFTNAPSLLVQCAGVDDLLRAEVEPLRATVDRQNSAIANPFDSASVTFEGPHPGLLGVRSISISMVKGGGYNEPLALDLWMNAILRRNGVYIISMSYLRRDAAIMEPIRQQFAKSVGVRGALLGENEMCR